MNSGLVSLFSYTLNLISLFASSYCPLFVPKRVNFKVVVKEGVKFLAVNTIDCELVPDEKERVYLSYVRLAEVSVNDILIYRKLAGE